VEVRFLSERKYVNEGGKQNAIRKGGKRGHCREGGFMGETRGLGASQTNPAKTPDFKGKNLRIITSSKKGLGKDWIDLRKVRWGEWPKSISRPKSRKGKEGSRYSLIIEGKDK